MLFRVASHTLESNAGDRIETFRVSPVVGATPVSGLFGGHFDYAGSLPVGTRVPQVHIRIYKELRSVVRESFAPNPCLLLVQGGKTG